MKVVVGLGNPGKKYERTRHNVGFDVLSELAGWHNISSFKSQFEAEVGEFSFADEKVLLVAPQTFMNLSGRCVAALVKFFKLPSTDLMVVCDDMNLPVGRLRLRGAGSAGGQKGLQNIIQSLNTQDIPRLRIGVGRPPAGFSGADYVLGRFASNESELITQAVHSAASGIECWVQNGLEIAMNQVNAPES
ncbi:aminoacyl-tRNA hydrolase [Gimesia aquarii]|uniref:aminoacyl-tRNA hydrolase n=1 Tax=Gimesia aquarii TaxID=2527964 RepID=UPI00119F83A1|nr:aminoacyl-tRNA hydrolase [Gimesia aquarii]